MNDSKLEAEKILTEVDKLAEGKIFNREDLHRLIDLALQNNQVKKLEELSFQARFSQGLLKIIRTKDNSINDEYFVVVSGQFGEGIEKIKNLINDLIPQQEKFLREIFDNKYFQLTQQSLSNLNNLCADLSYLKMYFNDRKRSVS
ncbi:MAG: hypothetical protein AB1521_06145 [Bacteroidota bacterium]